RKIRARRAGNVPGRVPAHAILMAVALDESITADHAWTGNENVREVLAPDQTVVEISVAAILIRGAFPRFCFVVGIQVLRRGDDESAGVEKKVQVVRQPDAAAQVF